MPELNYSPWGSAAAAATGPMSSMNDVALGVARLRYQQALNQQRMAIQLGQMALRQKLANAQIPHYQALTEQEQARTAFENARLDASEKLGVAVRGLYPQPDMAQGPTRANAQALSMGDVAQQAARSASLSGHAGNLLMPHNIGQNQIAINPLTGDLQGTGPMVISRGAMYQMPGQEAVLNPEISFAPAGSTPFSQTGQQLAPQTEFKPGIEHMGNLSSATANVLGKGGFDNQALTRQAEMFLGRQYNLYDANQMGRQTNNASGNNDARAGGPGGPGRGQPQSPEGANKVRRYNPLTDSFE